MTRFDWGSKGLLVTSLVVVTSLPSIGCRSGSSWSSMPPLAWFNRKKDTDYDTEGWASFDGATDVPSPSSKSDPSGIDAPEFSAGDALASSGRSGGKQASYESTDTYPRTSSPNPFSGMETGRTTSSPGYAQTARRDSHELWGMDPPTASAAPAAASTAALPTGPAPTDGPSVAPQQGYYRHQGPPAETTPASPPSAAAPSDIPPWSPGASSPAPSAESSTPNLPDWPGPATPAREPSATQTAPGAMAIPPSWIQNQNTSDPAPSKVDAPSSAGMPTEPWGPKTMTGGADSPVPWEAPDPSSTAAPTGGPARSDVPWRPGSTSNYVPQGQVPQGQTQPAAAAGAPTHQSYRPTSGRPPSIGRVTTAGETLVLAVDDAFPRHLYR